MGPYSRILDHLHYRILDVSSIKEAARRWWYVDTKDLSLESVGLIYALTCCETAQEWQSRRRGSKAYTKQKTTYLRASMRLSTIDRLSSRKLKLLPVETDTHTRCTPTRGFKSGSNTSKQIHLGHCFMTIPLSVLKWCIYVFTSGSSLPTNSLNLSSSVATLISGLRKSWASRSYVEGSLLCCSM